MTLQSIIPVQPTPVVDDYGRATLQWYEWFRNINQIVSNIVIAAGTVDSVTGTPGQIVVDNTDPANPIISLDPMVLASLALADTSLQPADIGVTVQAHSTVLDAYAGGDMPSPFTLSIVDSVDAAAWRAAIGAGTGLGTVTSISQAAGITATPNPIVGAGTIGIDFATTAPWTGKHTFFGAVEGASVVDSYASVGTLAGVGGYPALAMFAVGAPANNRRWYNYLDEGNGSYNIGVADDAGNLTALAFTSLSVAGAIATTIILGGAALSLSGTAITLSGDATFLNNAFFTGLYSLSVATSGISIGEDSDYTAINFISAAAAADQKLWQIYSGPLGEWALATLNDAASASRAALTFLRSGVAVTSMQYGNATDYPTHTFSGHLTAEAPSPSQIRAMAATGADYVGYRLSRAGGTATDWEMYVPVGSTTLTFYSGAEVAHMNTTGLFASAALSNLAESRVIGYNTGASFTYGGHYIAGNTAGYVGLVLYDGVRNPTFMSDGTYVGVYSQAEGYWPWYDNTGWFFIRNPIDGNFAHNAAQASSAGATGTYSPTLTAVTGSPSSLTVEAFQYMRVGNVVNVSGAFTWDKTGTGHVEIAVSLPIASALATQGQLAGVGESNRSDETIQPSAVARVITDTTNDRALVRTTANTTGTNTYRTVVTFQYVIV